MKIYSKENEYENKDFFESVNLISEDILKGYNKDRIYNIIGGISNVKIRGIKLIKIRNRKNEL